MKQIRNRVDNSQPMFGKSFIAKSVLPEVRQMGYVDPGADDMPDIAPIPKLPTPAALGNQEKKDKKSK